MSSSSISAGEGCVIIWCGSSCIFTYVIFLLLLKFTAIEEQLLCYCSYLALLHVMAEESNFYSGLIVIYQSCCRLICIPVVPWYMYTKEFTEYNNNKWWATVLHVHAIYIRPSRTLDAIPTLQHPPRQIQTTTYTNNNK